MAKLIDNDNTSLFWYLVHRYKNEVIIRHIVGLVWTGLTFINISSWSYIRFLGFYL